MASGDDVFVEHVCPALGNIETVTTRYSYSAFSGRVVPRETALNQLAQATKNALARLDDFSPFVVTTPLNVEIAFTSPFFVDILSLLKTVGRKDSHTITLACDDVTELSRFFSFIGAITHQMWKLNVYHKD